MKILILSLNFAPEMAGIGKYSGEMSSCLSSNGHLVRVITSSPYYPNWKIQDGYSKFFYSRDYFSSIKVFRCPLWVPSKPSGLNRLLHLASFAFSSFPILLAQWYWKPDVIWTVEPAFFGTPSVLLFSKLRRCPAWLHIQDYELDAAFDLGMLKGNWLKRLVGGVEHWIMRSFDRVSTISQRMLERAHAKGVPPEKTVFFPNWVDVDSIFPSAETGSYRSELNIPDDAVVALYSGNMGAKQGLELMAEAAGLCSVDKLYFIFCGNGAGRPALESACASLSHVRFLDLQPLDRLNDLLNTADIHLLPQRADAADLVMPSKLTGMLASGRPVVATAQNGTELANTVEGCGIVVEPGNAQAFADAICKLACNKALRFKLGAQARRYAVDNLSRDAVLSRFEKDLYDLVEAYSGAAVGPEGDKLSK